MNCIIIVIEHTFQTVVVLASNWAVNTRAVVAMMAPRPKADTVYALAHIIHDGS